MGFNASNDPALDVVILSNGPGELVTWVRPVVLAMRQQLPQARLSLIFSPCAHSSGQERQIAQDYIHVDRIQDADFFNTFLLTGQTEERWDWAPRGVVLFLGGDQFFTVVIAKRLGYRSVAYAEHQPRWRFAINAFGVRTDQIRQRHGRGAAHKMEVVGDLMMDGVTMAKRSPTLVLPGWYLPPAATAESLIVERPNPQTDTGIARPAAKTIPQVILGGPEDSQPDAIDTAKTLPQPILPDHPDPFAATGNSSRAKTEPQQVFPDDDDSTKPELTPRYRMPLPVAFLPRGWSERQVKGRSSFQIGILPGSKPDKLSTLVPFLLAVADELRRYLPNIQFVIPIAPGLSLEKLTTYAQVKYNPTISLVYGTTAVVERTSTGVQFVTPAGTTVALWPAFPPYTVFSHCDLCLTTVGANTAELTYLGVPMVVVLPLNKLDAMRAWDGIPGILARLPGVGSLFAKVINWIALKRLGLLAWPNIWAARAVVPELRGKLYPAPVAAEVAAILQDPQRLNHMRADLDALHGEGGAATKLVELVVQQMAKAKPQFRQALPAPKR